MVDLVISDLKHFRKNTGEEFKPWYNFATAILQSADVRPTVPQLAKHWSQFRFNRDIDNPETYYKNFLAILFLDDINSLSIERQKPHKDFCFVNVCCVF